MAIATKHLIDIIKARTDMMIPMAKSFKGDNIFNYNKINKDKPMPYIYLIIDEFATLMPESSDPKEVKEIKNRILSDIKLIGQMGGAIGVTYIIAHQKPEKELCPTFIKNMSNIRICFGFEDAICSQIVLGNNLALDLPQRVAYYTIGEGFNLLYTTNLDDRILPFIQDKLSPSHRTLFDDLKKLNNGELPKPDIPESNKGKGKKNKNNQNNNSKSNENQTPIDPKQVQEKFKEIQQSKQPTTPLEFNNVNPNSNTDLQKKIAENISKIPNFVPYNPNKNGTVIDRTIISPSEMQKPIKNNKGDE
jgi:S-DNA-T family DNA segregation ATPase FtsK/SpoIIIE